MHRFAVAVQWKLTKRRGKKSDSGHWEKSVGKAPTMATQPPPKISQTESGIKSDPHTHTPSQWKSHPFPAAFHNFPRGAFVQRGCNRVRFMFVREISLAQQRHHWKIKDFQFRTVRVFINYSSAAQLLSHTFYCKFWMKWKKIKDPRLLGLLRTCMRETLRAIHLLKILVCLQYYICNWALSMDSRVASTGFIRDSLGHVIKFSDCTFSAGNFAQTGQRMWEYALHTQHFACFSSPLKHCQVHTFKAS